MAGEREDTTLSDGVEEPVQVGLRCRAFAPALEAEFLASVAPAMLRNMQMALLLPALFGIAMTWNTCPSGVRREGDLDD